MSLQIFDCEQGSAEWFAARAGIPTASEFATVLAKGRGGGGGESKGRRTYMLKLVGERLTGQPMESYSNDHMERGKAMEDEARDLYAMVRDVEPERVGFMRRGDAGASPDSLIGTAGLAEIKTKLPHLQIEVLLANRLPPEHVAQVQGQLWISGREWCDFVSYWPGLPLFVARVQRDEVYIAALAAAVAEFNAELHEVIAQVQAYKVAA
jgi:hypothetical protein